MLKRRKRKSQVPIETLRRAGRYIPPTSKYRNHPAIKPLYWTEQRLEALLAWLQRLAFLEILGILGNVGILIAVATYIGTEKQRRDIEVLNAWQTITSAYGQSGSGGRIQALEFLNASPGANWRRRTICIWLCTWPAESLDGINLSVEGEGESVFLSRVNLSNAYLGGANLQGANLELALLHDAYLSEANLQGANLQAAALYDAYLDGANLHDANLLGADLHNTVLNRAVLQNANLNIADLQGADLYETNLENANLTAARLQGANLSHANLQGADLSHARLQGADLSKVVLCATQLPEGMNIDQNRDCNKLDSAK